jgi:hypothetical protein
LTDPAKVSGASDLANFPMLVNITSDNDLRTVANSGHVENTNGYDIIFTAADGVTKLDHQLEKYTNNTGELVAWVRVPNLSTTYSTTIYMYYGNTAIVADQSVNTTWNSNYEGVWHLNNSSFTDATGSANTATNTGSTNNAAAKIAGGRTCAGTGTNYVAVGLNGMSSGSGNGSIVFWGLVSSYITSTYLFGESSTQNATYNNRIQLYTGDNAGNLYLGIGGNHTAQTNLQTMATNTWYHIALTWSTTGTGVGNYSVFVNGVQKAAAAYTTFTAICAYGDIFNDGNAGQRTEELAGSMDEVRAMSSVLSFDWNLTEYNNQNSPSTFYSISVEPKVWNGGTNTNYNSASNWLSNNAASSGDDVIINNGTNQPTLQGTETMNSLFIRTGATLSQGSNQMNISRDIVNCGVLAGGSGLVNLNGGAAVTQTQNLSGSGTYSLNNLTINNAFASNPAIVLNKDVNVSGALVLTSGIVYTSSSNSLALLSGASSGAGSVSSFVSGPMSKAGNTAFVFPVGKGTRWRRAGISAPSSTSTFVAEYFNAAYTSTSPVNAPLDNVSKVEYWQIDRSAGTGSASLSLYWESASGSGIDNCPDLTIARWNGSGWDERAATTSTASSCSGAGTGIVTTNTALTSFSPFTFGSKATNLNPLPIVLVDFSAVCQAGSVLLKWRTASETLNDHFNLERSEDGLAWTGITRLPALQDNSYPHEYSFIDDYVSDEVAYYRLSQVDLDGTIKHVQIISADCFIDQEQMFIYPNPASQELGVEFNLKQSYGTVALKIIDALGKTCLQQEVTLGIGKNLFKIPLNLSPGVYNVVVSSKQLALPARKLIVR